MKCVKCNNELLTGDADPSCKCSRCLSVESQNRFRSKCNNCKGQFMNCGCPEEVQAWGLGFGIAERWNNRLVRYREYLEIIAQSQHTEKNTEVLEMARKALRGD